MEFPVLPLTPLRLCSPPSPPSLLGVLISFQYDFLFSGGRFGAEEDRFLVVYSALHSTTCPELVKCILNDLLEHQEEKVFNRFCSGISGISSRDSE